MQCMVDLTSTLIYQCERLDGERRRGPSPSSSDRLELSLWWQLALGRQALLFP